MRTFADFPGLFRVGKCLYIVFRDRRIVNMLGLASEPLDGAPVVGAPLVAQMTDASNVRTVAVALGPIDGLLLCFGGVEDAVLVVLDDVVGDGIPVAPFRASFDVNNGHNISPKLVAVISDVYTS